MENIVSFMGAFLKHIIGVLLLCWRRMLRAGLIAFAIGVVVVMLVAVIATGQAFPGALALVVALVFGAALAYGIALTVFIEEFLLGVVDLVKLLEGDVKSMAHLTATVAEREVGDVAHGLRRLFGLPVAARPAPPVPTLPALPALPRYPATPAPTGPHPDTLAREAALAGGVSLLAAAATVTGATSPARPASASAAVEPAAPAEPPATAEPAPTPTGEPVRADRLPRIGWTYEHEAIRPVRPAPPPETLAELAGAAAVGAGSLLAANAVHADGAPSSTDEPAASVDEAGNAPIVVAASEPEPPEPEPLDVVVVAAEPPGAPEPAAVSALADDAPPLDDERLAEPLALTLPDDEAATLASVAPLDPAMLAPAPATTPFVPVTEPVVEPVVEPAIEPEVEPAIDPAMLTPAPATTPLHPDEAPLDPAMLTPAPATTPVHPEDAPLDPAMLAPAPATTPFVPVTEPPSEEPAPAAPLAAASSDESGANASQAAPDEGTPAAASEAIPEALPAAAHEPAVGDAAARVRSAFSRVTRPVAGLGTALDAINRVAPSSGPRASAPESGLWERLSQALLDRTGAPSSPFAAPQGRPASPGAGEGASENVGGISNASASDETPQG